MRQTFGGAAVGCLLGVFGPLAVGMNPNFIISFGLAAIVFALLSISAAVSERERD